MDKVIMGKVERENYRLITELAKVDKHDLERKSLFYVIANDRKLTANILKIYNIHNGAIDMEYIENIEELGKLPDSSRQLLLLAVNLYNGYTSKHFDSSVMGILFYLDSREVDVFNNAIAIRLGFKEVE